ncbi:helicase [Chryseotalea sanaruensis]|uniref:Helicase n=1 Tax=Chryseotalea sanaruensis TaxID=2482724 RepID=A0A401U6B4_9BACT|nr:DEAD/DEAH box helicase [Chryseotalea sanaruensis]GCC50453.1 helicase [Chryseotalea sanaruensis]
MQPNLNTLYSDFLANLSIPAFNPMQLELIEKAEPGTNLMLLAPTGSGKTLAFLTAVFSKLSAKDKLVQAIIVAPSRELALQIEQVFRAMKTSYKVTCCYGGHDFQVEQNSLSEAPAVIIATPGRLADHIDRKSFDPSGVRIVVLDEFDKSLQMGFHDQLDILFKSLNQRQQHILTSATNQGALPDFLPFKRLNTIDYLTSVPDPKLELKVLHTNSTDKVDALMKLVASFNQEVCLVFCNHREAVERISMLFKSKNFEHGTFHGAMEQIDREKNLIRFRGGAHNVLISTDLASRGLDIPDIKHVVHYQLPPKEDAFIHRNGRTARMHAHGEAYLILADDESLPEYLTQKIETIPVPKTLKLPPPPAYACLYISAGKKDKVSKGDIVGFLTKKGGITGDDIGLIMPLDYASYVSIKRPLVKKVLEAIQQEKLKNIKVKVEVAN